MFYSIRWPIFKNLKKFLWKIFVKKPYNRKFWEKLKTKEEHL